MRVDRMLQSRIWGLMLALAIIATLASLPGGAQAPTPAKWTIMVYMCADNWTEGAAIGVVNRMEETALSIYTPEVNVVVQLDRITPPVPETWDDNSNGGWDTCHRFKITQDINADPEDIYSDSDPLLLNDLGEVDMTDPWELADFVAWAKTNYPADHYALVMWDYSDFWSTRYLGTEPVRCFMEDDTFPSFMHMTIADLKTGLSWASDALGKKIDLVVFDSDYMALMETICATYEDASYLVASEFDWGDAAYFPPPDTDPLVPDDVAGGVDYYGAISGILADPDISPLALGEYIGLFAYTAYPAWQGAYGQELVLVPVIDCSQVPGTLTALSNFANELLNAFHADPNGPFGSRIHTYWEIANVPGTMYGTPDQPNVVDLGCFAELVSTTATTLALQNAATNLVTQLRRTTSYPDLGLRWGIYQGISIYCPFNIMPFQEYRWSLLSWMTTWDNWIYTQPIGWGYTTDSFEPDSSVDNAKPLRLGWDQGWHWFHRADDMDISSFHANAGTLYVVGIDDQGPDCYPYMGIVGLDNATIVAEDLWPFFSGNYLVWLCPETGTYHVIVSQGDQYDLPHESGGYTYYSIWACAVGFSDVSPGSWAFRQIAICQEADLVGGYPDSSYRPGEAVTRDQMAVYVSRALAGGDGNVSDGPSVASFPDVPTSHWAYKYIEYARAKGVVSGYPTGEYRPGVPLDRAQMAVFIARAMAGGEANVPDSQSSWLFRDVRPDYWARKHIQYLAGEGVVGGYPGGTYRPDTACTRDQMAVFVSRAFLPPIKASPFH